MARPQKQTVDYFPHICKNGKTIYALENRYGNDGYAFWFKLLEILATTDGHIFDCNNAEYWEFLLAKTRVNEETANGILSLLSRLSAIDKELWESNRIIWSQNLVNNVADAYKRRVTPQPQKPSLCKQKSPTTRVSVNKKPQSKVKESKVKESKIPEFLIPEIWNAYLELRKKKRAVVTESSKALLIKKLEEFHAAGDDPNEVLKQSVMNGWTGIFPLDRRDKQGGTHRQSSRQLKPRDSYTKPGD